MLRLASIARSGAGRPDRLLAGYLCNIGRGPSAVRDMILDDISRFTDLGAETYALDLVQTLQLFDRACSMAAPGVFEPTRISFA
jgi:hypothetical protein